LRATPLGRLGAALLALLGRLAIAACRRFLLRGHGQFLRLHRLLQGLALLDFRQLANHRIVVVAPPAVEVLHQEQAAQLVLGPRRHADLMLGATQDHEGRQAISALDEVPFVIDDREICQALPFDADRQFLDVVPPSSAS
jgi:hypothetical protein